ncbi:transglutaminase-like domain-containing protein [Carboxylicivirga sp. N1Y90]|uniref:transglutaminase-like domain-containing protein n=1 Tax=Carboxylicivirga fragile TaxID=3417571 RepID=UPI003D342F32|nr:transglutaminase domain-containing protein [Marinilabiliaceae bacterium N1Y90]
MKKLYILVVLLVALSTSACNKYKGVPTEYHNLIDIAISKAGTNAPELMAAINQSPSEQKEAMAFLIAYMPERDLTTLSSQFLLNNVNLAYKTKEKYSWNKSLPDSIFFNEVLPYASLNERRDDWRGDFSQRFGKYVEECSDMRSAIDSINKNIRDELLVDYNTKREKPDQSPYESIEQRMASCSGLSILLTDAFRSVGIPSRIAGTPNWHDKRGNHNWSEVWVDGQWYFTEYYPSGLNKGWFLADAGKAIPNDKEHAIYASSFKPTKKYFPLVWDSTITYVPAEDVSWRYIKIYKEETAATQLSETHTMVKIMMFTENVCSFTANDRVAVNVDVFYGKEQISGGRTSGPTQDMNETLEFQLEKNKEYTFVYTGEYGKLKSIKKMIGDSPESIKLYYK